MHLCHPVQVGDNDGVVSGKRENSYAATEEASAL